MAPQGSSCRLSITYRREPDDGACIVRELFARYPDQLLFGTDGLVDRGACLAGSYKAWRDLLTRGVDEIGPVRDACFGQVQTCGLDLDSTTINECESELPPDMVERFLMGNFLALYD